MGNSWSSNYNLCESLDKKNGGGGTSICNYCCTYSPKEEDQCNIMIMRGPDNGWNYDDDDLMNCVS